MLYLFFLLLEILVLYFLSRKVVRTFYYLFYKVTKRKRWTIYLFAVLFLPGTFIHEISHFLAALFLLVPVGKLELLPKIKEEGNFKLGSVSITKTDPIRRFLVGVAPFVFGITIIFSIIYIVSVLQYTDTWWKLLLAAFLIFQIANSMFASKKDMEGAIILIIFALIIILILILLGVNIIAIFSKLELSFNINDVLKNATVFLMIPIFINFIVLLATHRFIGNK